MTIFKPLPDAPEYGDGDNEEYWAWMNGATVAELREWHRTDELTVSLRVKWWWRRTRRVLR